MNSCRILTVVGARPQFIKAAAISRIIAQNHNQGIEEILVHSGQHYDASLSQTFFDELSLPKPDHYLGVGSASHGVQTARILEGVENLIRDISPTGVLVYGDTNTTLAAALAAAKLHTPIAHVEAGLRSFNRKMPEETNRVLTDHMADILFCPNQQSVGQLANEGLKQGVHMVGDVMRDVFDHHSQAAKGLVPPLLTEHGLAPQEFYLATLHRAENTDQPSQLKQIMQALDQIAQVHGPVFFPIHPRTKARLNEFGLQKGFPHIQFVPPLSYLSLIAVLSAAKMVLTDSGGLQKEAFWQGKPCITLRNETEWTELVDQGWNQLTGSDGNKILQAVNSWTKGLPPQNRDIYGDGHAAERIVQILVKAWRKVEQATPPM